MSSYCIVADVHSKNTRSYNMSRIRSKDTKPELQVRKFLHKNGFRYKLHVKELPGKPDIVLPKYKMAIFIHGCFWHGHEGCKYFTLPKSNQAYWTPKINNNIERDHGAELSLMESGWRVLKIWECSLKKNILDRTLNNLLYTIMN